MTIGDDDGPGAFAGAPLRVIVDSRGRHWTSSPEGPLGFGSPAELPAGAVPAAALPRDSVLVMSGRRGMVLDSALRPGRQFNYPPGLNRALPLPWPQVVWFAGNVQTRELIGFPMVIADLSKPMTVIVRVASPTGARLDPFGEEVRHLIAATGNDYWSVQASTFTLVRWSAQIEPREALSRRPPWWTRPSTNILGNHDSAPQPFISAMSFDERGLLWVFVHKPAANWKQVWARVPANAVEVDQRALRWQELHTTTVEVIDLSAKRVVARSDLGRYTIAALPGRRVVVYAETAAGVPKIDVDRAVHPGTLRDGHSRAWEALVVFLNGGGQDMRCAAPGFTPDRV